MQSGFPASWFRLPEPVGAPAGGPGVTWLGLPARLWAAVAAAGAAAVGARTGRHCRHGPGRAADADAEAGVRSSAGALTRLGPTPRRHSARPRPRGRAG